MDLDWKWVGEKLAIPLLTGALGFLGATRRFFVRVDKLEKDFAGLLVTQTAHAASIKKGVEEIKAELLEKIKELKEELEELDDAFEKFQRTSSATFADDSEMSHFMQEQHQRWETVQRTLGQIEGVLRTLK